MDIITPEMRAALQAEIDTKLKSYRRGARAWKFLYYFFLYSVAISSAAAALILELSATQGLSLRGLNDKDLSAILAGFASVVATLNVIIFLHKRWVICGISRLNSERLKLDLLHDDSTAGAIINRLQTIIESHDEATFGPVITIQTPAAVPRIGLLMPSSDSILREVFRQGLRDVGYVIDQNLTMEERQAEGQIVRLPDLAATLVQGKVDVIVAVGHAAVAAAHQATPTIPIVMLIGGDPVGPRLIASLTRPGGNITGLAALSSKFSSQRLALLKEVVPTAARVAVLFYPGDMSPGLDWSSINTTAQSLGITLLPLPLQTPSEREIERVFTEMQQQQPHALITFSDLLTLQSRIQIVNLAATIPVAAIYELGMFAEAGGRIAYGPSLADMFHSVAVYVDQILKGAKPADLPVKELASLELTVNLRQATPTPNLTISPSVQFQANKVIL